MEVTWTKRIFERSISNNKSRYSQFYGDGDCKSSASVKDIYDGIPNVLQVWKTFTTVYQYKKLECVGYVQKRVGSRLRNLKIYIRGKLPNVAIDILQNYYGMAIKQNPNNIEANAKVYSCFVIPCSIIINKYMARSLPQRGW